MMSVTPYLLSELAKIDSSLTILFGASIVDRAKLYGKYWVVVHVEYDDKQPTSVDLVEVVDVQHQSFDCLDIFPWTGQFVYFPKYGKELVLTGPKKTLTLAPQNEQMSLF
jgi:hypothetical protein